MKELIMATSLILSAFLKEVEGLELKPYPDSGGKMTVGWGHLLKPWEPVREITLEEAEEYLEDDIAQANEDLDRLVTVLLNAHQRAAVASWMFNLGADKVVGSNTLSALNHGHYEKFADMLLQWNKVTKKTKDGGKVKVPVRGLTIRRQKERALFLTGDWKNVKG